MAKQSGQEPATTKEPTPSRGNGSGNGMVNEETLAAMLKANEAMLEGMIALQREILEFGTARLHQDMEIQGELAKCKDLQEAWKMQAEFAQKAMQQYSAQTAKLVDLSAKISRECWGPFEAATRTALQQVKTS